METENNWKYIVYCTTNLINNKIYIGVHKTDNPDEFDGYIGCGVYITQPHTYKYSKTYFQTAVNKYGVKNFKRIILATFNSEEEAYLLEEEIVNIQFLERSDVYNMIIGGNNIGEYNKTIVYQYDLTGNYITNFTSFLDAALSINRDYTLISYAVRKKCKAGNFFWSTDKLDKLDLTNYNIGTNQRKIVYQYNKEGNFLKQFISFTDAAKELNVTTPCITKAVKEGSCVAKQFYFSENFYSDYHKARTEYLKNREVHKYSNEGLYICSYNTQTEAEKENQNSNITKSIKTRSIDKNGFIWHLEKLNKINLEKTKENPKSKTIGVYSLSGELVKTYKSASQAALENGNAVWHVLAGRNNTHKGFVYKYLSN